jgi:hypothetical protein
MASTAVGRPPAITEVELHGIEPIPDPRLRPVVLAGTARGSRRCGDRRSDPGLDFSSVFPFLSRFRSTVLIGTLSIAIIFVGRFALDFVQTISTFATLIMSIGFFARRGYYLEDAVQVFSRGQRGGAYCFTRGVNYRSLGAWIPAAVNGLLFVNTKVPVAGSSG